MKEYKIDPETGFTIPNSHKAALTPPIKLLFLKAIREGLEKHPLVFDLYSAAKEVGVSKDSVAWAVHHDPKFAHEYLKLKDQWLDNHEMNIARQASKNWTASIATLKAHGRHNWRDKNPVDAPKTLDNVGKVLDLMKKKGYLVDVEKEEGEKAENE